MAMPPPCSIRDHGSQPGSHELLQTIETQDLGEDAREVYIHVKQEIKKQKKYDIHEPCSDYSGAGGAEQCASDINHWANSDRDRDRDGRGNIN